MCSRRLRHTHLFDPLIMLGWGALGGGGRSALDHLGKAARLSQHGGKAVHALLLVRLLVLQAAAYVWRPLSIPAALTGTLKEGRAQFMDVGLLADNMPFTYLVISFLVKLSLPKTERLKEWTTKRENLSFIHTSLLLKIPKRKTAL